VDAPRSEHHEHRPSPAVARWVERAVGYRLDGFAPGVHVGMPSGAVTLVVSLEEPLRAARAGHPDPGSFGSVLAGLTTAPTSVHHGGHQHGVQLALRPHAARQLFGCPAGELAQALFELVDVVGSSGTRLRDRLHASASWAERFAVVEETLLGLAGAAGRGARRDGPAPEVSEAWRVIGASGGAVPVRDVATRVGWSMRRLQREFGAEFGLSPKAAARLRRFERSVPLVASGRAGLSDVALRCGWSDHAHMDRDWRDLAGTAPSRWRAEDALARPVPRD
jgi:AraC-like DNA-binding protein